MNTYLSGQSLSYLLCKKHPSPCSASVPLFLSSFSMCRMAESDGCAGLTVPDTGTLASGMGDTASAGHMLPRISCWQGGISSGWGAPNWGEGGFTVGQDAPKLNIEGGGFGHQAVCTCCYVPTCTAERKALVYRYPIGSNIHCYLLIAACIYTTGAA